ncbi:MAG: hypothetical protein U0269_04855 [Polyangiales bacterium]
MQPNYYSHSGKIGALALPLGLGGGIAAAALLGTIYGQLMARIPVVGKITFIIAALAGAGYGAGAALLFRKGHGRSVAKGTLIAAIATFVGHYLAWASWISVVLSRNGDGPSVLDVLFNPSAMFSAISMINNVGAWSVSGGAATGGVLWALWGAEALIVIGCGLIAGAAIASGGVYCEHCNAWCKEEEGRVLLNPAPKDAVKQSLEAQNWGVLNQIGPAAGPGPCLRLDLAYCPKCEKTHAVAVSALAPKSDGNGTDIDTFVPYLNTSPEVSQWLRSIRQ